MDRMKRLFGFVVIIATAYLLVNVKPSGAWFVSVEESIPVWNQSASVTFVVLGGVKDYTALTPYVPGDNLVKVTAFQSGAAQAIRLVNNSTILTDIRFKISYEIYLMNEEEPPVAVKQTITYMPCVVETPANPQEPLAECDSNFVIVIGSGWRMATTGESEEFFYYDDVPAYDSLNPLNSNIDFIAKMYYNATNIINENQSKNLSITITFQSKQDYYVDWVDLGTLNY